MALRPEAGLGTNVSALSVEERRDPILEVVADAAVVPAHERVARAPAVAQANRNHRRTAPTYLHAVEDQDEPPRQEATGRRVGSLVDQIGEEAALERLLATGEARMIQRSEIVALVTVRDVAFIRRVEQIDTRDFEMVYARYELSVDELIRGRTPEETVIVESFSSARSLQLRQGGAYLIGLPADSVEGVRVVNRQVALEVRDGGVVGFDLATHVAAAALVEDGR